MYSPSYNRLEDRRELLEFMRANNFAVLVTGTGGTLHASHLPVQVRDAGASIVLDMHMAKNNPQWQEFFDDEVLVVFSGPHAYVSPRWYEEQERVPTWNYAAVHAYGIPAVLSEKKQKHESQRRLVAALDPQWLPRFDALRPAYVEAMPTLYTSGNVGDYVDGIFPGLTFGVLQATSIGVEASIYF